MIATNKRKPGEPHRTVDLGDAQIEAVEMARLMCAPYDLMINAHTPHHLCIIRDLLSLIDYGWDDKWAPGFVTACRCTIEVWRQQGVTNHNAEDWQLIVRDLVAILEIDLGKTPQRR